jgi:hypothetical protein
MCLSHLIPTPKTDLLRTCDVDTRFEFFIAVEIRVVVLYIMTRVLVWQVAFEVLEEDTACP